MNDNHSKPESYYRPRWIAPLLREAAKDHPVLVITGARQVGKSTLLQNENPFSGWRYLSLDDFDVLAQAKKDPFSLWAGVDRIIIDEVQKAPNILDAVKVAVDSFPERYRFILTGSANLLVSSKVSESLAGRAIYFSLNPMTCGEQNGRSAPDWLERIFAGQLFRETDTPSEMIDPIPLMWKGFMPSLLRYESSASIVRWWEGYVTTYLERDLRQLSQVDSLPDFKRLMTALALRCGQILNQSEVSRDTGISQPTIHRYINLMETTCLIQRLPAFAVNRTKRLIKSPKMMWANPGLVCFLDGCYTVQALQAAMEVGGIFESMVFLHLDSLCQLMLPRPRIYYWRTSTGKEVDFVLEWGRKLLPLEVKLTNQPKYSDAEELKLFMNEYPESVMGLLIHTGDRISQLGEKIFAVPWVLFR
jgi:predicted AAA+ superfamily ATPase